MGPADGNGNIYFWRQVLDKQNGFAFRIDLVDGIHYHAVAVGEFQVHVYPRRVLQLGQVQLPGGEHHLAVGSVKGVAVNVHVLEIVIGPDFLELFVGTQKRPVVPEADILDDVFVVVDVGPVYGGFRGVVHHLQRIEAIGFERARYVVPDVGFFFLEFVGFYYVLLDNSRIDAHDDDVGHHEQGNCGGGELPGPPENVQKKQDTHDH